MGIIMRLENKLKPCPFCGSFIIALDFDNSNGDKVICRECGGQTMRHGSEPEAIMSWNLRSEHPFEIILNLKKRIEELERRAMP